VGATVPGSNLTNLGSVRAARRLSALGSDVLASIGAAVIVTDLDGYILYWNPAAEHLYGWTADEVDGRNIIDVTPTDQSRVAAAAIFDRLTRGETWSGSFETQHKTGYKLLVDVTDSPIRDEQGKLTAVVGISKLIDDAKHTSAKSTSGLREIISAALKRISALPYDSSRDLLRGFAIAGLLYGLAWVARLLLDIAMPNQLPFISFFPALIISAYLCGPWPTIVLLIAASVTGAMWTLANNLLSNQILAGFFFLLAGGVVIAPVVYANGIRLRLQRQDERLSLLNRELKHRLKNLLAVTSAICRQTIKSAIPREQLDQAISGRLQAVASAQDLLSATGGEGSDLGMLVDAVVKPLSPGTDRLKVIGPQVLLPVEATMPFALILHELATNAVKYGAWASARGCTAIQWNLQKERHLEFSWREEAPDVVSTFKRTGFGTEVIKGALSQAKVRHTIRPEGAECVIELTI
jgi:PAS domain S-box-containing protein